MDNKLEEVVTELNYISAALEFLGEVMECSESEGIRINKGGVSYIVKILSQRSSKVSDLCWNIQSGCETVFAADNIES
ncbi:hypothetical protein [Desulfovibrio gilichinskyi]|uniref:Uncharacterized protein n=1 Tax=Desulfovibrio gilichinskyi TaxID=1519643 RepID=A0A1X7D264_9BACT|nr:hypothetical protein [Desulfovibrio gilichinskyi]SMF07425.1 hypothetical protein SAMN06295933_1558 [Desulfovibrio gilichinskyi]